MKKIVSIFMTIVIISGLCISVSAADEYDGYAYGSHASGGAPVFSSYVIINNLEDVEKLTLQVNFNSEKISAPKVSIPEYFTVEENIQKDKLILTVTEGNGVYENEEFHIDFDVLDKKLREEDIGFSVTAKVLFTDGSKKELRIKTNVDIYIDMPTEILPPEEIVITSDKNFFINDDTITFSIPVHPIDNAKKAHIKFTLDTKAFTIKNTEAGKDTIFTITENEDGYSLIYDVPDTDQGNINITFSIKGHGRITFFINCFRINEKGEESIINREARIPFTNIYNSDEFPHIVISDKLDIFRDGDTIYFPFTVLENFFEGQFSSSLKGHSAAISSRRVSGGFTDIPIATGDYLYINMDYINIDKIKICIMGDTNRNGSITAADARLALRHSAKIGTLEDIEASAADADRNGKITSADARMILRVASKVDSFILPEITMTKGEEFVISRLFNGGDTSYSWRCTVSDENAFEISDTAEPPESAETFIGKPLMQTFTLKALQAGKYTVHFRRQFLSTDTYDEEFSFIINVTE
ncbi:MAG: protease inhibitor I42 family protein [Clostridia bacterium]|nr:protease inhibitor I42 family protein [Clostridia bacterium]